MRESAIGTVIVGGLVLSGTLSLYLWLSADPPILHVERIPGTDGAHHPFDPDGGPTEPIGELIRSSGIPAQMKGAWPCFRGEGFDNIYKGEFEPVAKDGDFSISWVIDVGEGHAGAAILDGRVYLLDYDREKGADALRCLSLADGEEIWRYSYSVRVKRNHGMSRTVPFVTQEWIVSLGPKCHVTCLDSLSGEKKWTLNLVKDYDAEVPPWYAGQCPLIDGKQVVLAPGGSALMVAIDCETGETVWETPNPNGWRMTHSSIVPMVFNGKRIYVYCASGGVVGVSAEDGRIVWETAEWKIRIANVPSPTIIGDDRIFLSGGYEAGGMMLKLVKNGEQIIPETLFRMDPERFGSAQHAPIFHNGYIYGVRPDGELVCFDTEGTEQWTSTGAFKFGLGPYMIVGSLIHVMNDEGLLSRVEATPEAFRLVDQKQVLQGHDSWGPMAFASGRIIVRDLTRMACLDITAK